MIPHLNKINSKIKQYGYISRLGALLLLLVIGVLVYTFYVSSPPKTTYIHEKVLINPPATVFNMIPLNEQDHIYGNPDAPIKVVEYSDPECPFCKINHGTLTRLVDNSDGNVAYVYRYHLLDHKFSNSIFEAEALECAAKIGGNDAFWHFLDRLYELTPTGRELSIEVLPSIASEIGLGREAFATCQASDETLSVIRRYDGNAIPSGMRFTPSSIVLWPDGENRSVIIGARSYNTLVATMNFIFGKEVLLPEERSQDNSGENYSE